MRLQFNKIGYEIYEKEQSRRVPAVRAKPGNPGYGFRRARWRDPLDDLQDARTCEKLLMGIGVSAERIERVKTRVRDFLVEWDSVRRPSRPAGPGRPRAVMRAVSYEGDPAVGLGGEMVGSIVSVDVDGAHDEVGSRVGVGDDASQPSRGMPGMYASQAWDSPMGGGMGGTALGLTAHVGRDDGAHAAHHALDMGDETLRHGLTDTRQGPDAWRLAQTDLARQQLLQEHEPGGAQPLHAGYGAMCAARSTPAGIHGWALGAQAQRPMRRGPYPYYMDAAYQHMRIRGAALGQLSPGFGDPMGGECVPGGRGGRGEVAGGEAGGCAEERQLRLIFHDNQHLRQVKTAPPYTLS